MDTNHKTPSPAPETRNGSLPRQDNGAGLATYEETTMTIQANLGSIRPSSIAHHDVDAERVAELAAAMRRNGYDESQPVLVIEDCGNGAYPLDGHHRQAAAILAGLDSIPAWIVADADMAALLVDEFGGDLPARLGDLDAHIIVDGTAYDARDAK